MSKSIVGLGTLAFTLTFNWHKSVVSNALYDFHITVFQNNVLLVFSQSVDHCAIYQSEPTKVCFCLSEKWIFY